MAQKNEIWIADLNPRFGTEPGKKRPVVIVQTNLLNAVHPSTLVCPITTKTIKKVTILRVHLKKGEGNIKQASDILVAQIRAIDNRRFIKKVVNLPQSKSRQLNANLRIILDL